MKKNNFQLHFNELSLIIFCILIKFIIIFSLNFYYFNLILFFLIKPFSELQISSYFIFSNLTDIWFIKLIYSNIFSIYYLIPFNIFFIWIFFSNGLYKNENIYFLYYFFFFISFFIISFFCSFNYIIPNIYLFFYEMTKNSNNFLFQLYLEPDLNKNIYFIFQIYCYILLIFNFPFLILFFIKIFSFKKILNFRKYFYFFLLIIFSIISPPDFYYQCIISGPFFFLLEFLFLVGLIYNKY